MASLHSGVLSPAIVHANTVALKSNGAIVDVNSNTFL